MKDWTAGIALVLLAISLSGCRKTQSSDLVGNWVLKNSYRGNIPNPLKQCSPRLVLKADGTFQAFELPGYFATDERRAKLDSGKGEWKLRTIDGQQVVQLDFKAVTAGTVELPVPYGNQLWISSLPSRSLGYSIGGPDTGLGIELEHQH